MDNTRPVETTVEVGTKLVKAKNGDNLVDQKLCQSAIRSLLYLSTKTRADMHMLLEMLLVSHQN